VKKKKEKTNLTTKKGSLVGDNNTTTTMRGRTSTPMACYTFFHPRWRGGSHASKEDNNNNLDEKKGIANKKVPHS